MAERSVARTGTPPQTEAKDPFAELTRIIGFDPRVKIAKPAGEPPAQAADQPAATDARQEQNDGAPAAAAADWEAEFSNLDFDLGAGTGAGAKSEPAKPASQPASAVAASTENASLANAPADGKNGSAGAAETVSMAPGGTEESSERARQVTVDRPVAGGSASQPPVDAGANRVTPPVATAEPARREAFGGDALDAMGNEFDEALAASLDLELDDNWFGAETEALAALSTGETAAPEAAAPEPSVDDEPVEEAVFVEAPNLENFENELAALLGTSAPAPIARAAKPVTILPAARKREEAQEAPEPPPPAPPRPEAKAPEAAPRREEAKPAPPAEVPPSRPERTAAKPVTTPVPMKPVAVAAAPVRPASPPVRPPSALPPVPEGEDDPFAALTAMAARYRAAQFTPAPRAEIPQKPAAPTATPAAASAEAAPPKKAPEAEEMKRPSSVRTDTPEIDTVDVPEYPVATADDLDIPSDPYGSRDEARSARARFNEYDDEFNDLLQEMGGTRAGGTQPPRQAAQAYAPPRQSAPQQPPMPRASSIPAERRMPARGERGPVAADPEWDDRAAPAHMQGDEDYDEMAFREEFEEEQPVRAPAKPQRKRGRWFAALFGSVALVGACGAYALKFTGVAESGGPVLVKADAGPLKVRPENPGNAVVTNQENQVYDRVAGVGSAAAPQEKLLSSAEEPVSLDEPAEEAQDDETLPGLELSGDDMDMQADDTQNGGTQADAKADDRIDVSAEDQAPEESAPPTIAPRKVRTMVVKPDGTLAEREETQPAVQALASNAADLIETVKQNSMAAGVDRTDSTASVTPSGDDAAAGPVAATKGDDLAAEPAVAQPSGEWAVQIASQPSEAAARSSYTDLAKRYSAVLSGRPVSIVKADVAGKGTFWRVRVAAEDRGQAASLCTSYKAAGGNCFVTK